MGLFDKIFKGIDSLTDKIENGIDKFTDKLENGVDGVMDFVDNAADGLINTMDKGFDALDSALDSLFFSDSETKEIKGFVLNKKTRVHEFKRAFNERFGSVLRLYVGRSQADDSARLSEIGLIKEGAFECRGNMQVGTFINRMMEEYGLKVKVYTVDEWVAVLDGLTLAASGKVKKNATKADMEMMLAKPKEETAMEAKAFEEDVCEDDCEEDIVWLEAEGDVVVNNVFYNLFSDGTARADSFEDDDAVAPVLVIPEHVVSEEGKTYTVTCFSIAKLSSVKELSLPKTITSLDGAFTETGAYYSRKCKIELNGNPNIIFEGDIFYSGDKKELLNAQIAAPQGHFEIPEGVVEVCNNAFNMAELMESITFPSTIRMIGAAFDDCDSLETVYIKADPSLVSFYEEEGVEVFPSQPEIKYI